MGEFITKGQRGEGRWEKVVYWFIGWEGWPAERQVFDADYRLARFVVVDKLWHNWAQFNVPGVAAMMQDVAAWPLVFEAGDVRVYERR